MNNGVKKPWLSKTLWVNALIAVAALAFPPAQTWFVAHPDYVLFGMAAINALLRLISKDAITLGD